LSIPLPKFFLSDFVGRISNPPHEIWTMCAIFAHIWVTRDNIPLHSAQLPKLAKLLCKETLFVFQQRLHCKKVIFTTETRRTQSFSCSQERNIGFSPNNLVTFLSVNSVSPWFDGFYSRVTNRIISIIWGKQHTVPQV